MSHLSDLDNVEIFIKRLLIDAGDILKKYYASKNLTEFQKKGVDFTTEADRLVDSFLQKEIKKEFPLSNFLTEETAPENYSDLSRAENLWVIDPLDGTINFSRRHPNFAISIALMHKGKIRLGVVYAPLLEKLYFAREDREHAYLNDSPITVSDTAELRESVIACDWAWDLEKRKHLLKWLTQLAGEIRQIKSMGSAAADLSSLAEGKIDVYIHSGLKPWDIAAAGLIVKKAGGIITTPQGKDWSPFNSDILSSNKPLYKKILKRLV
jgi:myo-inositol-1(or 4)-monophosphatase